MSSGKFYACCSLSRCVVVGKDEEYDAQDPALVKEEYTRTEEQNEVPVQAFFMCALVDPFYVPLLCLL